MIRLTSASSGTLRDGVTAQRFEMKYIVSEYQAELVRAYLTPFVVRDPKAKFGNPYKLSSLYLDSPSLALFWASNLGENKRFKLRVRSYSEDPNEPVFLEIKGRHNTIVMKKRAMMRREWLGQLLAGDRVPREALWNPADATEYENLELFRDRVASLNATPRLHVRYKREAYMSRDADPVRITFDSDISCLPSVGSADRVRLNGRGWRELIGRPVILEVKFTDSYPDWVQEIPHRFSLLRDSFAKYVMCMNMMKQEGYDLKGLGEAAHAGIG